MANCPDTPKTDDKKALGFERKPMVDWFEPAQLFNTGIKAVLSSIFGAYADKREMQAALSRDAQINDYSENRDECWIDFTADLGDGFASTYSVARHLAAEKLTFEYNEKTCHTQRGKILIMGGDQVYPTATREEYQNRLVGPYTAALPCVPVDKAGLKEDEAARKEDEAVPHLYAIPGNHDWYDGLTAFTRLFMQERWIGGWRTKQTRSYFALKLPHNWWLLGIDIQLSADIDLPQMEYFKNVSGQITEGDRVILCTAQPDWVHVPDDPSAFDNLAYFEREIIRKKGAELKLTLTGDLHHYCHYENSAEDKHKITAGGGGAYLYPTHKMPECIKIRHKKGAEEHKDAEECYKRGEMFPDKKTSEKLSWGALNLPIRNYKFAGLLAAIYLLFAWVIQGASMGITGSQLSKITTEHGFTTTGLAMTIANFFNTMLYSPLGMLLFLLIVGGLMIFSYDSSKKKRSLLFGFLHGALHVTLTILLAWFFINLNHAVFGLAFGSFKHAIAYIAEMLIGGMLIGGFIMGLFLAVAARFLKLNLNEAFSCQSIADYKNFMRLHIDKDGKLTIYPVGITEVGKLKDWKLDKNAKDGASWFVESGGKTVEPELIETPIEIC